MTNKIDTRHDSLLRDQAGFTLVELMVALAIIAIMAAVGTSYTLAALPLYRLKGAARTLYSQMQQTRFNAVKENRVWRIDFPFPPGGAVTNDTYQIRSSGPDGILDNADDIVQTISLTAIGSGVTFGAGNAAQTWNNGAITQRSNMTFQPSGFCDMGSIYLTNQDNSIAFAITSLISGSIKMRKYNGMLPFNANNWMD